MFHFLSDLSCFYFLNVFSVFKSLFNYLDKESYLSKDTRKWLHLVYLAIKTPFQSLFSGFLGSWASPRYYCDFSHCGLKSTFKLFELWSYGYNDYVSEHDHSLILSSQFWYLLWNVSAIQRNIYETFWTLDSKHA